MTMLVPSSARAKAADSVAFNIQAPAVLLWHHAVAIGLTLHTVC